MNQELQNRNYKSLKPVKEDFYSGAIRLEDYEIYKGNGLSVTKLFTSVANDGYALLRIKTSANKKCLFQINARVEAKAYLKTYVGSTYTDNGTATTPINRYTDSTVTAETLFYHTPTVNVKGTQRAEELLGAGTNPVSSQSGTTGILYTMVGVSKDILIEIQNKAGSAKDISITIDFLEV